MASARNVGLDLLRLIAVILVLGRHLHLPNDGKHTLLAAWQRGGWIGVDLFFVLSGFLVSGLLFDDFAKNGRIDAKRFLVRRAWKIYPPFWVLIAFTLAVRVALDYPDTFYEVTHKALMELLFVQNYWPGLFTHTWTLGVEEHFYFLLAILLPAILAAGTRPPFRSVPYLFAVVATVCFALRAWTEYTYRHEPFDWIRQVAATHLRLDSLFYGTLLAYLCRFQQLETRIRAFPTAALVAAGSSLMLPAFILPVERTPWMRSGGVIMLYFASGLLVLAAIRKKTAAQAPVLLLSSLGAASYSIYLWHNAVEVWGTRLVARATGSDAFITYFTTYIIGSLALGWLMARLVETPVLALRDKCLPTSATTLRGNVRIEPQSPGSEELA